MVQVKGARGAAGEFGAVGTVEVRGRPQDVFALVGEWRGGGSSGGGARHDRVRARRIGSAAT